MDRGDTVSIVQIRQFNFVLLERFREDYLWD